MSFTIGSLFDGSGGFPLVAFLCDGTPVWASEVEPYPIAVTKTRFPYMKHLGSVTDIKGNEVEPVDVITFGSPCQDLSTAGKRAGLKHTDNGDDETTRSGLFMEAVRIIKEMREATGGKYPRFALWENVPGAFSSNKGEDFRVVCEELIKVVEPTAVMPAVPKRGWNYEDCYCGDGWSLAYRVLDAQHWGVPQRRRRIYLVLDLGGERAGEVLFEREGLRGYFAESGTPWQAAPGDAEDCTGTANHEGKCVGFLRQLGGVEAIDEVSPTLMAAAGMSGNNKPCVAYGISSYYSNAMLSDNPHSGIYVADTARTLDAMNCGYPGCNQGGMAVVEAVGFDGYNSAGTGDKAATLGVNCGMSTGRNGVCYGVTTKGDGDAFISEERHTTIGCGGGQAGQGYPCVMEPIPYTLKIRSGCDGGGKGALIQENMSATLACNNDQYLFQSVVLDDQGGSQIAVRDDGKCPTLRAETHGNLPCVLSIENHPADSRVDIDPSGKVQTLTGRMGTGGGNVPMVMESVFCTDIGFFASQEEVAPTLLARMYKDPHLVSYPDASVRYIVRRLTPTECARLQGFPDRWATPDMKTEFTDKEYEFWLTVRNTHDEITGKAVKPYTKDQMLTWYNKLHTDSAEYKLWGNGIALPTALYVMQGIAEVLK